MIQIFYFIFILKTSANPIEYVDNDKNLIIELSNDNFDEIISQYMYILVEFRKLIKRISSKITN